MKLLPFILLLSICLSSFSQTDAKKQTIYTQSVTLFYSSMDASNLNRLTSNAGMTDFMWSPLAVGLLADVKWENNSMLLASWSFKYYSFQDDMDMFLSTMNFHTDYSYGYRLLEYDKLCITPYAGFKGLLTVYSFAEKADISLLDNFSTPQRRDTFFATDINLICGVQFGLFKNKYGAKLINIRFDVSLWNMFTENPDYEGGRSENCLTKQNVFISLGINPWHGPERE